MASVPVEFVDPYVSVHPVPSTACCWLSSVPKLVTAAVPLVHPAVDRLVDPAIVALTTLDPVAARELEPQLASTTPTTTHERRPAESTRGAT
jgi:hypothetical protein